MTLEVDDVIYDRMRKVPKVLLHDHLDGGLRPQTVVELAADSGWDLPEAEAHKLNRWFTDSADSGSLEKYLDTFTHTVQVMQTADAIERVAREAAVDLAADGVVYAEIRWAPELLIDKELQLHDVVEAALRGFAAGEVEAKEAGHTIRVGALLTAMRHTVLSREVAELAVTYRDQGVVGFDIAGAEAGYPPSRHLDAFEYLHRENFPFTIHAGEAFGLPSIWEAVQVCGADRLGHGVRIVDDIDTSGETPVLGRLAGWVRDKRIPLEMCPSSNVQTGAAESIERHPISLLKDLRYRITINTDNRLMSGTTMSREFGLLAQYAGWQMRDFSWASVNAMKSAFIPFDQRLALINDVIKPGYEMS